MGAESTARIVHGLLMCIAFMLILPFGVMIARYGKPWQKSSSTSGMLYNLLTKLNLPGDSWVHYHTYIMVIVALIVWISFIISMTAFGGGHTGHGKLGFAIAAIIGQQALLAFFRPHPPSPGETKTWYRFLWEQLHRWSGRFLLCASWLQIYIGLVLIKAPMGVVGAYIVWTIFIALLFIGFEVKYWQNVANPVYAEVESTHGTSQQQQEEGLPMSINHQ